VLRNSYLSVTQRIPLLVHQISCRRSRGR
jgi:hypothetical protein